MLPEKIYDYETELNLKGISELLNQFNNFQVNCLLASVALLHIVNRRKPMYRTYDDYINSISDIIVYPSNIEDLIESSIHEFVISIYNEGRIKELISDMNIPGIDIGDPEIGEKMATIASTYSDRTLSEIFLCGLYNAVLINSDRFKKEETYDLERGVIEVSREMDHPVIINTKFLRPLVENGIVKRKYVIDLALKKLEEENYWRNINTHVYEDNQYITFDFENLKTKEQICVPVLLSDLGDIILKVELRKDVEDEEKLKILKGFFATHILKTYIKGVEEDV